MSQLTNATASPQFYATKPDRVIAMQLTKESWPAMHVFLGDLGLVSDGLPERMDQDSVLPPDGIFLPTPAFVATNQDHDRFGVMADTGTDWYVGDWIIRHADGSLTGMHHQTFLATYVAV